MNTNQQKLNEIYQASTLANLPAQTHETLKKLATELFNDLDDKTKEEIKTPEITSTEEM